ncbi:flagellar hook-length control protein [Nocardia cyriacigeorgica]|nr:flagellar hook-length control protein [Nocardia cyriacigeorgica]MBF6199857.1 flagellar hook-length control protein [Nocardia cyriacigeorgica]
MSVADDVAAGRLSPADLDATLVETCKALVGTVVGPSDPLWSVQVDIARGVLAAGGIPAGELAEWAAVAQRLADADPAPAETAPGDAEG